MTPAPSAPPAIRRSPLLRVEKKVGELLRAISRALPGVDEEKLGQNTRAETATVGPYELSARRTWHMATGHTERSLTVLREEPFTVYEARELHAIAERAASQDPIRAWTVDRRTIYFRWPVVTPVKKKGRGQ